MVDAQDRLRRAPARCDVHDDLHANRRRLGPKLRQRLLRRGARRSIDLWIAEHRLEELDGFGVSSELAQTDGNVDEDRRRRLRGVRRAKLDERAFVVALVVELHAGAEMLARGLCDGILRVRGGNEESERQEAHAAEHRRRF